MFVLGLDPGYEGAGVTLDGRENVVGKFKFDLHINGRKMYDVCAMAAKFEEVYADLTVIEDQHRWPKLMMGFGVLWTLANLYSARVVLVAPRTWQAYFGISGKRKDERASRTVAEEELGLKTNDHNIAEAGLLALYALRRGWK